LTEVLPVSVTFDESESVTSAGTQTLTYLVYYGRVWLAPQKLPSAKSEFLQNGPSVLWRRRTIALLPVGTEVERIFVRPERAIASTADVLLGKSKGLRKHTRRIALVVGPKGALEPK
jgi:hypothetical protein